MDYTFTEINKHKIKINTLSNQLINTVDINEEILISNEIKKEAEILLTLLNMKMIQMANQISLCNKMNNNINFVNPMINQNMMNMNMNQFQPIPTIDVIFKYRDKNFIYKSVTINCRFDEKIDNVIQRYKIKSNNFDINEKFICNASVINPNLTVAECGLNNLSVIQIIKQEDVQGG